MLRPMRTTLFAKGMIGVSLLLVEPVQASDKGWDKASNVAVDALVLSAFSIPVVLGDWDGALQAGGSLLVAEGAALALKQAFPEWRPDRSDRHSFPSGHTSVAFAAAATLENRYGWEVGLPAHVAAIFVGVARVEANKHHWYDAAAGAALGELSGWLITRRRDDAVQFFPWVDNKAVGFSLAGAF